MWTAEETSRLHTLQTEMKTVAEIAADLHKHPIDVQNKLISLGFKPRYEKPEPEQTSLNIGKVVEIPQRKRRTLVTPDIEKRVCELREQQFKFSEIAEKTGLDRSTCSRIVKRNGGSPYSRIVKRNGLPIEKRYVETNKPAPVAAETSSENIKTHSNITPSAAICKDLIKEAKATLENAEPRKTFNSIGKALEYIEEAFEEALKIWEE